MILIHDDIWRSDCIASFGLNKSRTTIHITMAYSKESYSYYYDSTELCMSAYREITSKWKKEIEG